MLRGNHQATVDEKGRLKIPAAFLAEVRKYGREFFVTSETGEFALIFPLKVWVEREKKVAALSMHDDAVEKYLELVNYFGQDVTLDSQGRLLLPPVLRETAKLAGAVDVIGNLQNLRVWNHERFLDHMQGNRITREDKQNLAAKGI